MSDKPKKPNDMKPAGARFHKDIGEAKPHRRHEHAFHRHAHSHLTNAANEIGALGPTVEEYVNNEAQRAAALYAQAMIASPDNQDYANSVGMRAVESAKANLANLASGQQAPSVEQAPTTEKSLTQHMRVKAITPEEEAARKDSEDVARQAQADEEAGMEDVDHHPDGAERAEAAEGQDPEAQGDPEGEEQLDEEGNPVDPQGQEGMVPGPEQGGPVQPYGYQILERSFEDAAILMQDNEAMLQLCEEPSVRRLLTKHQQYLATMMDDIETITNNVYGANGFSTLMGDMSLPAEENPDGLPGENTDADTMDDNAIPSSGGERRDNAPSPEEALDGMAMADTRRQLKEKGKKSLPDAHTKSVKDDAVKVSKYRRHKPGDPHGKKDVYVRSHGRGERHDKNLQDQPDAAKEGQGKYIRGVYQEMARRAPMKDLYGAEDELDENDLLDDEIEDENPESDFPPDDEDDEASFKSRSDDGDDEEELDEDAPLDEEEAIEDSAPVTKKGGTSDKPLDEDEEVCPECRQLPCVCDDDDPDATPLEGEEDKSHHFHKAVEQASLMNWETKDPYEKALLLLKTLKPAQRLKLIKSVERGLSANQGRDDLDINDLADPNVPGRHGHYEPSQIVGDDGWLEEEGEEHQHGGRELLGEIQQKASESSRRRAVRDGKMGYDESLDHNWMQDMPPEDYDDPYWQDQLDLINNQHNEDPEMKRLKTLLGQKAIDKQNVKDRLRRRQLIELGLDPSFPMPENPEDLDETSEEVHRRIDQDQHLGTNKLRPEDKQNLAKDFDSASEDAEKAAKDAKNQQREFTRLRNFLAKLQTKN